MGVKASVWALHYSDREDSNGETLGGFTTLNCYASYTLKNGIEVYAKGFNITNEDYELAYGYNTMGRSLFVGANYSF
jgi:vitamin B12 transporter